jgi:hypothetical protein
VAQGADPAIGVYNLHLNFTPAAAQYIRKEFEHNTDIRKARIAAEGAPLGGPVIRCGFAFD